MQTPSEGTRRQVPSDIGDVGPSTRRTARSRFQISHEGQGSPAPQKAEPERSTEQELFANISRGRYRMLWNTSNLPYQ